MEGSISAMRIIVKYYFAISYYFIIYMKNQLFTNRLKTLIETQGTARQFAIKANIPEQTINSYLKRGSLPDIEKSVKIAKALGITVEELLTGRNPEKVLLRDADERIYVEKLLRILRSNDDLMKRAIIPNLDAFDGRLIQTEDNKKNSEQKSP